jgi:hypothetical protein
MQLAISIGRWDIQSAVMTLNQALEHNQDRDILIESNVSTVSYIDSDTSSYDFVLTNQTTPGSRKCQITIGNILFTVIRLKIFPPTHHLLWANELS